MTPVLEEAIRLLEQSRRDLVALLGEDPVAHRAERCTFFETLLDIAEGSARHDAALEEALTRLEAIERRRARY